MPTLEHSERISLDDARRRGFDSLIKSATDGHDAIITDDDHEVVAIVSAKSLTSLEAQRSDMEDLLGDLVILASRLLTSSDDQEVHDLDEVLEHFGYTREELLALPEAPDED